VHKLNHLKCIGTFVFIPQRAPRSRLKAEPRIVSRITEHDDERRASLPALLQTPNNEMSRDTPPTPVKSHRDRSKT
jgi:hypothetical protein